MERNGAFGSWNEIWRRAIFLPNLYNFLRKKAECVVIDRYFSLFWRVIEDFLNSLLLLIVPLRLWYIKKKMERHFYPVSTTVCLTMIVIGYFIKQIQEVTNYRSSTKIFPSYHLSNNVPDWFNDKYHIYFNQSAGSSHRVSILMLSSISDICAYKEISNFLAFALASWLAGHCIYFLFSRLAEFVCCIVFQFCYVRINLF